MIMIRKTEVNPSKWQVHWRQLTDGHCYIFISTFYSQVVDQILSCVGVFFLISPSVLLWYTSSTAVLSNNQRDCVRNLRVCISIYVKFNEVVLDRQATWKRIKMPATSILYMVWRSATVEVVVERYDEGNDITSSHYELKRFVDMKNYWLRRLILVQWFAMHL